MTDIHNPHRPCPPLSYEVWGMIDYYRGCLLMVIVGGFAGLLTGSGLFVIGTQLVMLATMWTVRRLIDKWVKDRDVLPRRQHV